MGLEHRIEVLTQNISHLVRSVAGLGTHLHRPHEERKAEHLLVPIDRAFNIGDADAHMVYTPWIGRTFGWISLSHSPDYFFMNWSTLLATSIHVFNLLSLSRLFKTNKGPKFPNGHDLRPDRCLMIFRTC